MSRTEKRKPRITQKKPRMDNLNISNSRVQTTRQDKVRVDVLEQNGVEKQINPTADKVTNQVKSIIKYELDIDEDDQVRESVIIRSTCEKRAQSEDTVVTDAAKANDIERSEVMSNFSLNQNETINIEHDIDDEPVIVYSNSEKRPQTAEDTILAKAIDIGLNNSSNNVPLNRDKVQCDVNIDKEQVQEKQAPFNSTVVVNQTNTSVEYQNTCKVPCNNWYQTLNVSKRLGDASRNNRVVLEQPTKRSKLDVFAQIVVNNNNINNNNIGAFQQRIAAKYQSKLIALKLLKIENNKKSQSVNNYSNQADEDMCEIVYEKNTSNKQNQNNNSRVKNFIETTIQNTSGKLPSLVAQPIKKVFLVQLDQTAVNKILTDSSTKLKFPIVNQHKSTFGTRWNSGSKEVHDNCGVESILGMPMENQPTFQPDVSETNRSTEESSTVWVPEREALSPVNAIGKTPLVFADVDGS